MDVTVHFIDARTLGDENPRKTVERFEVLESDTIHEVFGVADISWYYPFSGIFSYGNQFLPYMVRGGDVLWNINYREAEIGSVFQTLGLESNEIFTLVEYDWTSPQGFRDITTIWENAWKAMRKQTADEVYAAFESLIKLRVTPHALYDFTARQSVWTTFDYAFALNLSRRKAKIILETYGYVYDTSADTYIRTESSEILKTTKLRIFNENYPALRRVRLAWPKLPEDLECFV